MASAFEAFGKQVKKESSLRDDERLRTLDANVPLLTVSVNTMMITKTSAEATDA